MSNLIEAWSKPPATTNPEHAALLAELRANRGQWARVTVKIRVASKLARENRDLDVRFHATGTPQQAIYMRAVA